MSTVIDYAWGRPSIAALKARGAVAVCRYLAWPSDKTAGKLLTPVEAAVLTTGGLAIVSNWEQAGSWAEYSRGYPEGAAHAAQADLQHRACGGPPDRPIYFSVDFDATDAQLPSIIDYYRGVASVIGLDRTGAYGGYRTIAALFKAGVITWGWQTYAWSAGQWDPRAQLRQVRNGVLIDGVDCDINESMTADFGQWGTGDIMLTADEIEQIVSALWWRDIGPEADKQPAWQLIAGLRQPLADILAAVKTPAPVALTDEQVVALAGQVGAHLDDRFAKLEAAIAAALEAAARVLETPPA